MKVNVEDLSASDFPGIDEAKFNEWKALKVKKDRERRIVLYIWIGSLVILGVVSALTARPIVLLIFLPLLAIDDLIFFSRRRYRHLRRLEEELGMSARLRGKKQGQAAR